MRQLANPLKPGQLPIDWAPHETHTLDQIIDAAISQSMGIQSRYFADLEKKWVHKLSHCELCGLPLTIDEMGEGLCTAHTLLRKPEPL